MVERCADGGNDAPGSKSAAFFDVDGTIVSTHIVHQYVFIRKVLADAYGGILGRALYPVWLGMFYVRCLHYLYLDRVSRTRMNVAFYRNYRGLRGDRVRAAVGDCFERVLLPHMFVEADRCIRDHLQQGRVVVLVTGSIDFIIQPLARHFGADVGVIARTLVERNGRLTGALDGPPIGERQKAEEIERYVRSHGIDLADSYAYGDSIADLPMLDMVGHPNVINADRELTRHAEAHGWRKHQWRLATDGA